MALPGWYSLASVVEIHAVLEGIAVAFFVALVAFDVLAHLNKKHHILFERIALVCFGIAILGEVCAYPYSRRIDTLSKEATLATEREIAVLNKEAGEARKKAGEAEERATKLEVSMMLRRLTKEQGDALCSVIPKPLANQIVVTSSSQDWEAFRYAADFNEALRKCITSAGLEPSGGVGNSFWSQDVTFGVWIRFMKHFTLDNQNSTDVTFNPSKRRELARIIRGALESHGVKIAGVSDEGRALIEIYVGPKFPPPVEDNSSSGN